MSDNVLRIDNGMHQMAEFRSFVLKKLTFFDGHRTDELIRLEVKQIL